MLQVSSTWVSGMRFSAGCLSFICHEDSARFSTLKIDARACNAFKAHRARAATCGTEQWAFDNIRPTPQLYTLQITKSWVGPRQGMNEWSCHGLQCQSSFMWSPTVSTSRHLSPTLLMHIPSPVTKTTIGLICICLGEESPSPPHHYQMKSCSSTAVTTVRLF